jgi:tRNA modification GTPase
MKKNFLKTIFAQSSAKGIAGVSVYRISGDLSLYILKQLTNNNSIFEHRKMYYRQLKCPNTEEIIDNAMVVYFKAPESFTGEDVVELHCHGSIAISLLLTSTILSIKNVRMAEAGEFAQRAFFNGKFDLTAAEGLADLIEAQTIMQHRQAIKQSSGELYELYEDWRKSLLKIISFLEAYIDFPDEEIPNSILEDVTNIVENLKKTILIHLNDNRKGELLRDGIKLAVIGKPNVGKSSLVNFLMQRELSIVSNIAGTTRDVIEGHLDIGGYKIILQDTAGIRDSTYDIVEQEGIKRALEKAKLADIKILMFDILQFEDCELFYDLIDKNTIIVVNKIDLINNSDEICNNLIKILHIPEAQILKISIVNKIALDKLLKKIEEISSNICFVDDAPHISRARHRNSLKITLEYLNNFSLKNDLVLATEDIRMSIRTISSITGKITIEEILGEIFSKFCIGK